MSLRFLSSGRRYRGSRAYRRTLLPFSYLDIVFRDGSIKGTLVVHVIDVAHELDSPPPSTCVNAEVVRKNERRIGEVLRPRILLQADRRLSPTWTGIELLGDDQALKLTYRIPDARQAPLAIDTNLFPVRPESSDVHQHLRGREPLEQFIFNAGSEARTYYLGTAQGAIEVMKTFVRRASTTS